jgi:hypothetical protein
MGWLIFFRANRMPRYFFARRDAAGRSDGPVRLTLFKNRHTNLNQCAVFGAMSDNRLAGTAQLLRIGQTSKRRMQFCWLTVAAIQATWA